jgi:hypothetical protein
MSYCNNCGSKIEGNDLFCSNCGSKVSETPNESQNKEREENTFEHAKSVASQINYAEIINILKTSALDPVCGGKQFVDKAEKNIVIIITLILTFLQGILGIWRNNQLQQFIVIPYDKIFIQNCGLYLIGVFVLFMLIYLGINILVKINCKLFTVFKIVVISTLPIFTCEIISIIFSYFSLYLGIGFFILGALISIATMTLIVSKNFQIKDKLCVLIVSVSFLIALSALFIALKNFIAYDFSNIINETVNSLFKY